MRQVRRSRLLGACALTLLVASTVVWSVASPAGAQQPNRSQLLQLVSQTAVVEPDGDVTIRLRVNGAPPGSVVRVDVHDRVPTRSDFAASLDGKTLRRKLTPTPITVPATPDAAGTVGVTFSTRDPQSTSPPDASRVRLGEGVYPIEVVLADAKGAPISQLITYVVRLPAVTTNPPLGVVVTLPVDARPSVAADGASTLDPGAEQSIVDTSAVLAAHQSVPVTISPFATTVDALDGATVGHLHDAVAGRELASTPFAPVRPGDWIRSGMRNELGRQFDRGAQDIANALGPMTATVAVTDDHFDLDAARFLQGRGVRDVVVPDTVLAPLDGRVFNRTLSQPFQLADANGLVAIQSDSGLVQHVGETGDPVLDANHLLGDLGVLYFDDPPDTRAVALELPDHGVESPFLDALLGALTPGANRALRAVTVADAVASTPLAGSKGETNGRGAPLVRPLTPPPGSDLSTYAARVRDAYDDLGSYETAVTGPNSRPDDLERRILASGATGASEKDQLAQLDGVRSFVRNELAKIATPARQTINFTARDGTVSFTVKVQTGYPVALDLALDGNKLQFPGHDDGHVPLTLPDGVTRISLDVRTRASGDSPMDLTFRTPDGRLVVGRTRFTIRSTAFSGVGVVLSVGALTFLLVWWARHIVTTRRSRSRPRHAAGQQRPAVE